MKTWSVLPPFEARVVQRDRMRIVEVDGEVDILTAPKLAAAVKDDHAFDALVLDVARMPFISSTGLSMIVALHRRLARRGGGVAVVSVQPLVKRILELVGLIDALILAADVPTAVKLLGHEAAPD
ncbi:MAG TPA: STAS domain-containing protein [Solirubrobacteraceae bacterium]